MSEAGAAPEVLVVVIDPFQRARTTSTFREGGYAVVETDSFHRARSLLVSLHPRLLITDIQLGAFNGLHLAWVGSLEQPAIPAIVIHQNHDAVLESEARTHGCAFLIKPLNDEHLLLTARTLLGANRRHWPLTSALDAHQPNARPWTQGGN